MSVPVPVPDSFRTAYDEVLGQWPGPVDRADLRTPYGVTRVNSCGSATSPPLVLLPGGGATSTVWGACAAAGLARRHRVHGVDLMGDPGFSAPEPGRPVRSVDDLVGWLDAVLDGIGPAGSDAGPVLLGGHSYGAWIAAHYAARRPERVAGLALLDPTRVFTGLSPRYVLRALPMLARPTSRRIRSFLTWEAGGTALDAAWLRLQEETAGFPAVRPVTGPSPDPAPLRKLSVRVLLAGSARCHDPGRVARAVAGILPEARTEVLPGVSHHAFPLAAADRIAQRWGAESG
ncbi:alpha/beta fold hydrolase [Streptomyces sp. NPDC018610]|jgi:pimeloyl-ACP methyl ester carboxylesterase|uniref:alpha/beta fold hydrolase n=1 Tax=Streptomyces sp. NPDC018610 TaxID=3365049 RepID=UPI0037931725